MTEIYLDIIVQKYSSTPYKPLTYIGDKDDDICVGKIIIVPFKNTVCLGIVEKIYTKMKGITEREDKKMEV